MNFAAIQTRRQPAGGFTLVELMITLAIIALLATMVYPVRELTLKRERERELRSALREIRTALDAYHKAAEEGRVQKAADASGYPESLEALEAGIEDASSPDKRRIYFLRRLPRDPMHPSPTVPAAATWGKRSYASSHDSPQEGRDVFDVYSLSRDKGLNGVPYRNW